MKYPFCKAKSLQALNNSNVIGGLVVVLRLRLVESCANLTRVQKVKKEGERNTRK